MGELIANSSYKAVVGMGATGLAVARHLRELGQRFVMMDTRQSPPNLATFQQEFEGVALELGPLNQETLCYADEIVLSPGLALSEPPIAAARAEGIAVVGDIELFARAAKAPIVAITGSNAKSTVTTLLGEMAAESGLRVSVGGNLGRPALDLLSDKDAELFVLELSSFQLETTKNLNAAVATVLNVSDDHMDRYEGLPAYMMAKHRVYYGAKAVVVNRQDTLTRPPLAEGVEQFSFGLDRPDRHGFGVIQREGEDYIAYEFDALMPVSELSLPGRHNTANALAALALGQAIKLPMAAMLSRLRTFKGLPHRCQWLRNLDGVDYFDDSKGTNVGATEAAISGLSRLPSKLILIAGGIGKGAQFSQLAPVVSDNVRAAVLLGRDARLIAEAFDAATDIHFADSMSQAVSLAQSIASKGDAVLLSPACASFDMFEGFEHRGQVFTEAVGALQ